MERKCIGCGKIEEVSKYCKAAFCRSCSQKDQYSIFRWPEVKRRLDSAYKKGYKAGLRKGSDPDNRVSFLIHRLHGVINMHSNKGTV